MPAHLVIHDGSPWWASPDIWVVPGPNPTGSPGSPIAGTANYLWARVSNDGNVAADGCRVDFYWADPSAVIMVGTATLIGSAFVNLPAGGTEEVLCLAPWHPTIVNGGHECVLAVVHGPGDENAIPDPLPNGYDFNPPAHDQIAQLNLSVLLASMLRMPLTLFVKGGWRTAKRVRLEVQSGGRVDERVLSNFGLKGLDPARKSTVEVLLGREAACGDDHAKREIQVDVARRNSVPVFVHINAQRLPSGQFQLVNVVERDGDRIVGGVSYLIVNSPAQAIDTRTKARSS